MESFGDKRYDRKMSTSGVKNKWIKAFRSLKLTSYSDRSEAYERRNEKFRESSSSKFNFFDGQHQFQENTYKKITACDVCREILRGHSRQGLKCKLCKMNVHSGQCQDNAPKCQPKPRLLRKQKSASELETKLPIPEIEDEKPNDASFVDPVYQSLKAAAEARRNPTFELSQDNETSNKQMAPIISHEKSSVNQIKSRSNASSSGSSPSYLLSVKTPLHASSAPQSPVHSRKFLFCKHRMCSVDLPDANEKSTSPSPCPSPKPQRLLPTNIFVVLYNFRGRHQDELDLKAGYTVTVVDTTDPDWWQGKCLGRKGFFPSNYVTKLFPGEKPLQVCHTIQLNDGEIGIKLLREQIVIQVVEEVDGIIMIRTGINDKIVPCPIKYLQEI